MDTETKDEEIKRLREALKYSRERFYDLAQIAKTSPSSIGSEFLEASAERIEQCLEGGHYHDDIYNPEVRLITD